MSLPIVLVIGSYEMKMYAMVYDKRWVQCMCVPKTENTQENSVISLK